MKRFYLILIFLFSITNFTTAQKADVVLTIGHTDQINSVAIDQQGKRIATGGNDNLIKIWDISTTKELRTLTGNDGRVVYVEFDATGNYISALNYADKIITWKVATGEIVSETEAESNIGTFDHVLDNEHIAFRSHDSKTVIFNFKTGEIKFEWDIPGLIRQKISPDKKSLYYFDHLGNIKAWDISNGTEIYSYKLFEKMNFPFTRFDISSDGKYLAASFTDDIIRVVDLENKKTKELKGHTNKLTDLQFANKEAKLISADHEKHIYVWDAAEGKKLFDLPSATFGVNCMAIHPSDEVFIYGEFKTLHYASMTDGKDKKSFVSKGNRVVSMDYAQNDKYIAAAYDDISIKIWDLSKNKVDKNIQGFFPVCFAPQGKYLACMGTPTAVYLYDPENGEKIKELDTEYELIQNLSFSKDGKYLAGAGFGGVIRIWNIETGKIEKRLSGHAGGIYGTSFHPNGNILASAGLDQTVRIWDLKTEKLLQTLNGHEILVSDVDFSPDGKLLASSSWDKKIILWNTSDWSINKKLEGHINAIMSIDFSVDSKKLASSAGNNTVWKADNSIRIWDVETGETICKLENPTGQINQVVFDDKNDLLYSSGNDGYTKVWNLKECKEEVSLVSVGRSEYIFVTPDYYYTASREALTAVSFRINENLYPFEQFDIRLNRPDIISQRIGKTPEGLINAYKYVYEKRLKKLNLTDEQLGKEFHLPVTKLDKENIPLLTESKNLKFTVYLEDEKYLLDRLMIYQNGVPVVGRNGIDLLKHKTKTWKMEVEVELMNGSNHFQVSCINEKGVESLIENFGIVKEVGDDKHEIYLVAIGVSDYQQKEFNLNYAAKDADDIIKKLQKTGVKYEKVHQLLLKNEEVTKEKWSTIKDFIAQAGINDVVIVFMAGHGVLDENFDYYFATHNMNFEKPAEFGIAYAEIESLMDAVKAIRKLLLMDTCHSGELDKDEIKSTVESVSIKEVKFRSVGTGVKLKDQFGVGNTQSLMNVLFSDLEKGTGATIISSSSGAEFSMESDEYKNGLFTYCLLNSLSDWNSDLNRDQRLTVSEWSKVTFMKVLNLSGGMQQPTSRSVNVEMDFRVW